MTKKHPGLPSISVAKPGQEIRFVTRSEWTGWHELVSLEPNDFGAVKVTMKRRDGRLFFIWTSKTHAVDIRGAAR